MKYTNILFAAFFISMSSQAATVEFDLRDASVENLDGGLTLSLSSGGIATTLTANMGELNRTTSGFGINAPGAGDDTDGLDAGETITFVFDTDILLSGFTVSALSSSESGFYNILGSGDVLFATSGFNDLGNIMLNAGEFISVKGNAGSYSLDSMTVANVSAVPLPAAFYLLISGFAPLALIARRQKTLSNS